MYVNVNGGQEVVPILGLRVNDGNLSVTDNDEMLRAWFATQNAVETQLKSAFCLTTRVVIKFADGSASQSAIRLEAKQHFVGMETALVHALSKEGQLLASAVLNVAGQLRINTPRVFAASLSLQETFAEPLFFAVREDASQAFCYAI